MPNHYYTSRTKDNQQRNQDKRNWHDTIRKKPEKNKNIQNVFEPASPSSESDEKDESKSDEDDSILSELSKAKHRFSVELVTTSMGYTSDQIEVQEHDKQTYYENKDEADESLLSDLENPKNTPPNSNENKWSLIISPKKENSETDNEDDVISKLSGAVSYDTEYNLLSDWNYLGYEDFGEIDPNSLNFATSSSITHDSSIMRYNSGNDLNQGQNLRSISHESPQSRNQLNGTVRQYPKQENMQLPQSEVPVSSWPEEWRHLDILASDSASMGSWQQNNREDWSILR